jgi:hypothetical protein
MSRPKRTSAVAGIALALALAVTPAAQAAGPVFSFPTSWLEIGLDRLAGWLQELSTPLRLGTTHAAREKLGTGIDANGAHSQVPPPTNVTGDISTGTDPNG